jgi:3-hydroxyacyl-CoA dehydrogenase/enoyl-CoA hydratase/3-hydroxybutyryl-CoA epimerase
MAFYQAESLIVELEPDGTALLWLDVPQRTYNVFSRQVLVDLDVAFDKIAGDPTVQRLVILSRKATGFAAGADLHEFAHIKSGSEAMAASAAGQRVFDKLAALRTPTVAVISGPCLGGGLEFALACDYRIVLDQPGTQLGFPEIELGLIPGWGGTQRFPKVVGLERALQVILMRKRLDPAEALRWGLADALVSNQDEALDQVRGPLGQRLRHQGKVRRVTLPRRTWRQRLVESTPVGRWLLFRGAARILDRRVPDDMPAPREALQALQVGLTRGLAAGLAFEREAIGRLATTTACRNLMTLFFLIERAREKGESTVPGSSQPRRIGVVGAGTMGAGIAQLAAIKGYSVVVQEVNAAALAAGMKKIDDLFRKAAERRVLPAAEAEQKLKAIGQTTNWEGFGDVDLAIEAVIEDLPLKQKVFRELEQRTRPDAVLATNTSSLQVHLIQKGMQHPERVAGLHFFNPVHKMPLVEVVNAPGTKEGVPAQLAQWAASLGKTPVVVRDGPGFIVNRILMPYLNEAGMLVAAGMAIEEVDQVMRRFGMPMGPLELLDQVGLDVAAHIARAVGPAFGKRLTPHPALEKMVAHGWLGQKSNQGFYLYRGKDKKVNSEALNQLQKETASGHQPAAGSISPLESRERMVCLMVNEAAACLAEGLGERADVVDLAMVLGTGWAPHRGGPLRYADDRGPGDIVATLEDLTRRLGPRFEPCSELRRRAATGEPFYDPASLSLS